MRKLYKNEVKELNAKLLSGEWSKKIISHKSNEFILYVEKCAKTLEILGIENYKCHYSIYLNPVTDKHKVNNLGTKKWLERIFDKIELQRVSFNNEAYLLDFQYRTGKRENP